MTRIYLYLCLLVFLFLIVACTTTPPDAPICVEINMQKGRCVKIISGEQFVIDETHPYAFRPGDKPKTWWQMRPAMVQVPPTSWAEIKAFIIKICNNSGECEKEVGKWERSVEYVDSQLAKKPQ